MWDRKVLLWDLRGGTSGTKTDLPMVDHQGNIKEGEFQTLYSIRAVSLPEKRGKIEVEIHPSVGFRHVGQQHILERFTGLLGDDRSVTITRIGFGDETWPHLIFNFCIQDEESFCDAAITIVKAVLNKSGVQDNENYLLGHFTLSNATFVEFEAGYISLVRWLRITHGLPIHYVGDDREIPLVEPKDLA